MTIQLKYLERKPRQPRVVFMQVLYPGQIGIWDFDFRNWRKTLGAKQEPTTNSTHIWCQAGKAWATFVHHPCSSRFPVF